MEMTIDSLDKQLVDLLIKNARVSSIDLANQLNVNSSTIRRRMKRLIEQEIIHIVAIPDPNKVGIHMEAIISLNVSQEYIEPVLKALRAHSQVRWVSVTSGRFDIMAYVWCSSTDDLYKFIENEVGKLEGVNNSETFVCLHIEKRL